MKIYITLGTQDKEFKRLLEYTEQLIEENVINKNDEIYIQKGQTKFKFKNGLKKKVKKLILYDFRSFKTTTNIIKTSDIVISHSGVGTILDTIKNNKKIIVVPRLKQYEEHVNDHQLDIAKEFEKEEYIYSANNFEELKYVFLKLANRKKDDILELEMFLNQEFIEKNINKKLKKYKSNNQNFINQLVDYIDKI